jgi:hypothetical protein
LVFWALRGNFFISGVVPGNEGRMIFLYLIFFAVIVFLYWLSKIINRSIDFSLEEE